MQICAIHLRQEVSLLSISHVYSWSGFIDWRSFCHFPLTCQFVTDLISWLPYVSIGCWNRWCAWCSKTSHWRLDKRSQRRHHQLAWVELRVHISVAATFPCNVLASSEFFDTTADTILSFCMDTLYTLVNLLQYTLNILFSFNKRSQSSPTQERT